MDSTAPSSRPASQKSGRSSRSRQSQASSRTSERTPLLARDDTNVNDEETEQSPFPDGSGHGKTVAPWKSRWPSVLALFILFVVVLLILFGFLAHEGIEEYALHAADFNPTKLSLDSLTKTGVKVRVEGDFMMDASKVQKKSVRNIGRFGTWIAHEVESGPADVDVYLPEYDNVLLGTAIIPGIKVNIRNGKTTHISFLTDLSPGSFDGIRNIANDWLEGRLGEIRVKGKARVPLKSGLIRLGTQIVEQVMLLKGNDLPTLPAYNITKINLREAKGGNKGMGADVTVAVTNDFPVQLTLPPVAVDVMVDGCLPHELITVGTAETAQLHVEPNTDIQVNVTGHVERLPDSLTTTCPDSAKSPLDLLLGHYMHGHKATLYINCCEFPDPTTPGWAKDLLKDITVPIGFAGRSMGNLIKNFSLDDAHFFFPDEDAAPGTPESNMQISGVVKVEINLPDEMNFPIQVKHVKADSEVFYHKKKLGNLNLKEWQKANSSRIDAHGKGGPSLLVEADIEKAPFEITDSSLLVEIMKDMFFWHKTVMLDIKARVSVEVDTPMGQLAVRDIPAAGVVPVKPLRDGKGGKLGHGLGSLSLKVGNLTIIGTSPTSLTLQAHVNLTNPTNYSATIPYVNINFLVNDTTLGQGIARDILVHPGNNTNVILTAVWDPFTNSGDEGKAMGKEFLSQYVSGFNTSITLLTHSGTIPAQPSLGAAFSAFPFDFPTPHLAPPKDHDDNPDAPKKDGHFIQDATMHIISSTALFTLASPFRTTTLYITSLNATAFYESHPSGKILYELPFAVPPGLSVTPRFPVDWSLSSVGYEAIKKALGGELRLSAFAEVGIRIGEWRQGIWYQGKGIGAKIRL